MCVQSVLGNFILIKIASSWVFMACFCCCDRGKPCILIIISKLLLIALCWYPFSFNICFIPAFFCWSQRYGWWWSMFYITRRKWHFCNISSLFIINKLCILVSSWAWIFISAVAEEIKSFYFKNKKDIKDNKSHLWFHWDWSCSHSSLVRASPESIVSKNAMIQLTYNNHAHDSLDPALQEYLQKTIAVILQTLFVSFIFCLSFLFSLAIQFFLYSSFNSF